jgi:hypothetical protein
MGQSIPQQRTNVKFASISVIGGYRAAENQSRLLSGLKNPLEPGRPATLNCPLQIQRAAHPQPRPGHHMRIDLSRAQVS